MQSLHCVDIYIYKWNDCHSSRFCIVLGMRTVIFSLPGAPIISQLTFIATARTITCISMGGPATNVTWKMGGSELTVDGSTYQFMQTLTDGTTSTYTNVFTIVSSDLTSIIGSNFTCQVENTRGRAAMNITIPCENNVFAKRISIRLWMSDLFSGCVYVCSNILPHFKQYIRYILLLPCLFVKLCTNNS